MHTFSKTVYTKRNYKKLNLPNTPQVKSLISNIKGRHKRTRISKYYNWEEEGSTTKRIRILNIRKLGRTTSDGSPKWESFN